MTEHFPLVETQYGFNWGPLVVERLFSDPKFGVVIALKAGDRTVEVRVSPAGRKLQVDRAR